MAFEMFEATAAVTAALFGGIGVKVLEKMMNKKSEAFSDATQIRDELRIEIANLRKEADEWKEEADEFRGKYYESIEENIQLNQQFESLRLEYQRLKLAYDAHVSGSNF